MVAHEYAHGYVALTQGDPTAQMLGRLTLNPLKHIDPWLTVLLPILLFTASGGRLLFGGAKPVPVTPANYRDYRRGDILVSSAGIVVNLLLFVGCLVAAVGVGWLAGFVNPGAAPALLQRALFWGVWLNLLLAFFNLIPIPPLDGSHLLFHALPREAAARYRRFGRYGFLALIGLVVFAPRALGALLTPAFALHGVACRVAEPYALAALPLCRL
jgi:Zn-dependent protease